jgi:hypothetical protein
MTLGYVFTAGRTIYKLGHAIPFRSDTRWLVVIAAGTCCLVLMVVLLAIQFKYRKVPILRLCSLGLGVLSVVVIVLRQQVISALIVIWVVLIGYLWADWVFRRMGATRGTDNAEWVAIGSATGLALLSIPPLTLGLTGVLTFRWILITLVVATLLQVTGLKEVILKAWRFIGSHRRLPDAGDPENAALECLITAIFFFNLCWALSPELSFDALNYQLAVPRFYLESHSIIDLPYFWHSYFARLVNSLYLLCLALGGPITCKLLMLTTGLITTLGVWAFTCKVVNRRAALWAVAIFYSTPLVGLLSTVAYVDLTLGMFVITTWLAFLRWQRSGEMPWLLASAVLAGPVSEQSQMGHMPCRCSARARLESTQGAPSPSGGGEASALRACGFGHRIALVLDALVLDGKSGVPASQWSLQEPILGAAQYVDERGWLRPRHFFEELHSVAVFSDLCDPPF